MKILFLLLVTLVSCTPKEDKVIIKIEGSDTMLSFAQTWAEEYKKVKSKVAVEVSGGGSGAGIAGLINGTVDIANSSRAISDEEKATARKNGMEIKEYIVGHDALTVFVHPGNPLKNLTLEEIACIYGEFGTCNTWADVRGTVVPGCNDNKIIRVSHQPDSGTYQSFLEATVGKNKDMKQGSMEVNSSREAVNLVEKTSCAISYADMSSLTDKVTILCLGEEGKCISPSLNSASDKTYPLTRTLYMYTSDKPKAEVKAFMDWAMSSYAKNFILQSGFIPH